VIASERVNGTTKSGRARVVSIDEETVTVLRQRKADQAAEQLKAADAWRGTKDGYVFTTGWGEPIYPDTVTSLMTEFIRAHTQLPHAPLHDVRHYADGWVMCPAVAFPLLGAAEHVLRSA
jgi:integrase